MATRRRWLQFSLRTAFVLLTIGCVWLGILDERAREQREAVKAIEALGGTVGYDFEIGYGRNDEMVFRMHALYDGPSVPESLRRLTGDDFFQEVWVVEFWEGSLRPPTESEVLQTIPALQRLRQLKQVRIPRSFSEEMRVELAAALPPNCKLLW